MNPARFDRRGPTFPEEGQDYLLALFDHCWPPSGSDHSHGPFILVLRDRTPSFFFARIRVRSLTPCWRASFSTSFCRRAPCARVPRRKASASAVAPVSPPSAARISEAVNWVSPVQRNLPSPSMV